MAAITGLASDVAWTGYTGLYASPGYVSPYAFTLDIQSGVVEATRQFPPTIVRTHLALPYSWSGTITCRAHRTAVTGYSGSVSWSDSQYDTNIREWSLDLSWGEKDVTAFDGSGVVARTFLPLLASWRGAFSGFIDGTTALTLPNTGATTIGDLTLKLLETTTDDTLSGSAIVTQVGANVSALGEADVSYTFEGTGQLTAAGTNYGANSSGIFDDVAGTLKTPAAGSLVLTATSGRTYTGNAFPNRLSWRTPVDGGIECVIGFRGTGALSIA